jgi:sugar phosphate permease
METDMFDKASAAGIPDTLSEPLSKSAERAVYAKINMRIIPVILCAYIFAYLDRINVGYTQLQMKQALGFSDAVYGLGAGLFFITYLMFEVPSNLWLERVGARKTFMRIMVLWGLCSTATMFIRTPTEFYLIRLMLGACEAGFFPGIMLYLTYWYPSQRRGRVTGMLLSGIPISGLLGGAISGTIMSTLNTVWGLEGWQWVFVLEGIPTVFFGFFVYWFLADRPHQASWLNDAEKAIVNALMDDDHRFDEPVKGLRSSVFRALANPQTYVLSFVYFCLLCMVYAITFWLPTMIKLLGVNSLGRIGWGTVIPYAFGLLGLNAMSYSSDMLQERRLHVASTLIVGSCLLFATTLVHWSFLPMMVLLCVASFFIFASALFWAIPPTLLGRESAAAGIAVISSVGTLGGFVSPWLIGTMKDITGSMQGGLGCITVLAVIGGLVIIFGLPERAFRVGVRAKRSD